jgi:uncharacterized repeat protein (TIGR01451 family)
MHTVRPFQLASFRLVTSLALVCVSMIFALATKPVSAQESSLTLSLVPSTTKAKVGELISFDFRVENTGVETINNLVYGINLPDALNSRGVSCGGIELSDVTCQLDIPFGPGSITEALFFVEVGARSPNGPVSAFAAAASSVLATVMIPAIKVVGPPNPH